MRLDLAPEHRIIFWPRRCVRITHEDELAAAGLVETGYFLEEQRGEGGHFSSGTNDFGERVHKPQEPLPCRGRLVPFKTQTCDLIKPVTDAAALSAVRAVRLLGNADLVEPAVDEILEGLEFLRLVAPSLAAQGAGSAAAVAGRALRLAYLDAGEGVFLRLAQRCRHLRQVAPIVQQVCGWIALERCGRARQQIAEPLPQVALSGGFLGCVLEADDDLVLPRHVVGEIRLRASSSPC